jgi:subtilase family serine protease
LEPEQRPGNRVFIEHEVKKVPQHWIPMPTVAHPNKMFNLIFAIKQRNTDKLTRIFESVSDPKSSNYGNYLTIDQITAIVEPAPETISTIVGWLATHGLTDYTLSANRDMIFVDAPLQVASRMFDVQFQSFIHRRTGKIHTTTKEAYSAPAEVAQLLDFVVGFNGFPSEPRKLAKTQPAPAGDGGFQVGPHELRQRYNVTQILAAHPNNKQAVAEFQGEYYSQSDLQTFMKKYYPSNTNPAWWTATVKGTNTPSNPSTEGSLDIEYIMGVGMISKALTSIFQHFSIHLCICRPITDSFDSHLWIQSVFT